MVQRVAGEARQALFGGLQALVAYTFSRSEDTAFILHPAIERRAPSIGKAVDIPHNLVMSWAYQLPIGPGSLICRVAVR